MNLTVLNVAYPLAPVGPDAAGGAEQVLARLDAALVEGGHRSIVLAAEGSTAAGILHTIPSGGGQPLTGEVLRQVHRELRRAIRQLLHDYRVDVVHMHGIDFHAYLPVAEIPTLATLHLPPSWYPREAFFPERPETYLHCVSRTQENDCPAGALLLPAIENGVPAELFTVRAAERRFALALGRICPEKGFHLALDAAASAGVRLLLAGKLFRYDAHERYFHREIAPRLDRRRRYIGPVGFGQKRRLLESARCLLVPSLAPETSSLVAMEAQACGTPVIAFRSGALADIVEHGQTGFLVADAREMADAIAAVDGIDAGACRRAARERFCARRMTGQYLERYRAIAGNGLPRKTAARAASRAPWETDTIATVEDLQALRPEWSALWADARATTPFQSPEWLIPWWRCLGAGELLVLALRRRGKLFGLLPLFIRQDPATAERTLLPLGAGISDYCDALFAPGLEASGADQALESLAAMRGRWDVCALGRLPASSALLRAAPGAGWNEATTADEPCLALELDSGGISRSIPARLRANLRYYRRRAEKLGEIKVECATDANLEEFLSDFFRLHRDRWAERGEPSVLAYPAVERFHRAAARGLLRLGALRLYVLRVAGRAIAAHYGFSHRRRAYYYLGGFDPEFKAASPGTLLIGHAVERALLDGAQEFDFLRGRESYKYLWGAAERATYNRTFRRASRGRGERSDAP